MQARARAGGSLCIDTYIHQVCIYKMSNLNYHHHAPYVVVSTKQRIALAHFRKVKVYS